MDEGLASLIPLCEAKRIVAAPSSTLRFNPSIRRIKELVDGGRIGKPLVLTYHSGQYLPDWHPWEDYRTSYSGRADLGGGALLTFSHELDSLCWALGAPSRVVAMAAHASALEIDTEDSAEMILQFPDGPLASVHVDYLRRPPQRSLEIVVGRVDHG